MCSRKCKSRIDRPPFPSSFEELTTLFNGNVISPAKFVVSPIDAEDISKVVIFCNKHALSLSVKSGGYGTAGWAVNGDVVVLMSRLDHKAIDPPDEHGSFSSFTEERVPDIKESVQQLHLAGRTKRRRSLGSQDPYLGGEYEVPSEAIPRTKHRRVATHAEMSDDPTYPTPTPSASGSDSPTTSFSGSGSRTGSGSGSGVSTSATSMSPTPSHLYRPEGPERASSYSSSGSGDPFGYLDSGPTNFPPPTPQHIVQSTAASTSARQPGSFIMANANLPPMPAQLQALTAEPLYPHAYVTFGAGTLQMELDTFTAQNPLPTTGNSRTNIPYHIPTSAHPVGSTTMISGGFGFLSRLHGLSIDNVVEVEMVLASGEIVVVNETDQPGPCSSFYFYREKLKLT